MRANALCWNPAEPLNFAVACEDHRCYVFDARQLARPSLVHAGHVGAVLSVSYSPTGRELATGSYDRTVRLWRARDGRARDVYHARRMQRVSAVLFSADARFVLSASDDTNVRVWKAASAAPLKALLPREKRKLEYAEALKKRHAAAPDVRRIAKFHRMPKNIKKTTARLDEQRDKAKRKDANRRAHTRPENHEPRVGMRDRVVVKEQA